MVLTKQEANNIYNKLEGTPLQEAYVLRINLLLVYAGARKAFLLEAQNMEYNNLDYNRDAIIDILKQNYKKDNGEDIFYYTNDVTNPKENKYTLK